MNKKLLIGAGLLALAGISYYVWKKNKDSETNKKTSNVLGSSDSVNLYTGSTQSKCEAGKIWCTRRGVEGCFCNEPKPISNTVM